MRKIRCAARQPHPKGPKKGVRATHEVSHHQKCRNARGGGCEGVCPCVRVSVHVHAAIATCTSRPPMQPMTSSEAGSFTSRGEGGLDFSLTATL